MCAGPAGPAVPPQLRAWAGEQRTESLTSNLSTKHFYICTVILHMKQGKVLIHKFTTGV